MSKQIHATREAWLVAALWQFIDAHFIEAGYEVPANIRCTCGFPAKHALARKHQRVGECWAPTASMDNTIEISVSPVLSKPMRVLDVLIHEVVHAVVGLEHGHRAPFSQCAKKVGLLAPWVGTSASDDLKITMAGWIKALGPYPHAALVTKYAIDPDTGKPDLTKPLKDRSSNPPQSTRMLKFQCDACGCIIRTTRKWTMTVTGLLCGCGHGEFFREEAFV